MTEWKIMTNKIPKMLIVITIKMKNEFCFVVYEYQFCRLVHTKNAYTRDEWICVLLDEFSIVVHSGKLNLMWYLYWQNDESNHFFTLCYVNLFTVKSIKIGFQCVYTFLCDVCCMCRWLRKTDNDGNELNRNKCKLHHPIFGLVLFCPTK